VLLVLGVAIYLAAATSLASAGTAQLHARLAELTGASFGVGTVLEPGPNPPGMASGGVIGGVAPVTGVSGPVIRVTSDPSQPGLVIGGDTSGTIALMFVPGPDGSLPPVVTGGSIVTETRSPDLLALDPAAAEAIAAGGEVILETSIGDAPVRVLAAPVAGPSGTMTALVIGDRSAEVDTLRTLLAVLLVGGVAVLGASVAFGYVYAGRALVPIRDSLRRQREFAADASHELRTPLAINRAAIAALRRGRDDPAVVDRALDDLEAGNARLELLVDDLLLLARTDADAVELATTETDLALAAAEACEALEVVAGTTGVRLVLDVQPAPLRGDEARLRQLAGILVDNAIRHSPGGGRVTVTVRPGASLVVEDEGPGIAPEHLELVFERFWRAPGEPAGGTGLGLPIARWIAERHGGSVVAECRAPGPGARFSVQLPSI
jgi:two-component system, OmpR family, sensor histidine kinase CiaH